MKNLTVLLAAAFCLLSLATSSAQADDFAGNPSQWPFAGNQWPFAGNSTTNSRTSFDPLLYPPSAGQLQVRWVFTTAGDVSATPTVDGENVYVPDWGGYAYKLDRWSGNVLWKVKLSDLTGNPRSVSRTAMAIGDDVVVLGDQVSGTLVALTKSTGALSWKTVVDPHPYAIITAAPVIFQGRVYVGVASGEEGAISPGYTPSFRGSVAALDLGTGAIVWQFKTAPVGYTGNGVWGSTPAIDPVRGLVYVGTGNNYSIPPAVATCVKTNVANSISCLDPNDWVDSALAIELDTGKLRWGHKLWNTADTFTSACLLGLPNCPDPAGPDYDVGSGPNLFQIANNNFGIFGLFGWGGTRDVVGVGQKSGVYWALDPDSGQTIWSKQVGPGGPLGGIQWGSAADGTRVYVAIANSANKPYTLANGSPWNAGSWAALDATDGHFLWQIPVTGIDPSTHLGGRGLGGVSAANGIMFAGSSSGDMVAIDGATGKILWTFASGGTVVGGPSIVGHAIYWGSGYSRSGLGIGNNKLYCFTFF